LPPSSRFPKLPACRLGHEASRRCRGDAWAGQAERSRRARHAHRPRRCLRPPVPEQWYRQPRRGRLGTDTTRRPSVPRHARAPTQQGHAHTDRTPYRDIEDTSALLSLEGGPTYAESYVLLNDRGIARLGRIAVAQGGRVSEAADEREVSLGRVPSLLEALGRVPDEEWDRLQQSFES
jgi:hypothetical protein